MTLRLALVAVILVMTACSETGVTVDGAASTTQPPDLTPTAALRPGSLPPSSTTADGSLAGVQGVVRITTGLDDLAHDWGLTDPEGNYIGPVDENGSILLLKPIEGYGDFSGLTNQQRFDLDPTSIQRLTYR